MSNINFSIRIKILINVFIVAICSFLVMIFFKLQFGNMCYSKIHNEAYKIIHTNVHSSKNFNDKKPMRNISQVNLQVVSRYDKKYDLLPKVVLMSNVTQIEKDLGKKYNPMHNSTHNNHYSIQERFYQKRKYWKLSKLGNIIYKREEYPKISERKKVVILIWKYWEDLKQRHLFNFRNIKHDPLSECSVKNCEFTGDVHKLPSADAVLVHLQHGDIPSSKHRNPSQRWIFLNDEAPRNAFFLSSDPVPLSSLHNVFNWSMTFQSGSDVPVPYGYTVPIKTPQFISQSPPMADLFPNWKIKKRKGVLVTILLSHCGISHREKLISELKKHLPIDVYGKCGPKHLRKSCPGYIQKDCAAISKYLFYLVSENTICSEYMTEKLFHNAYSKGSIPIIQSPSAEECDQLLPPHSYLHVDNYSSFFHLAQDVIEISEDENKLLLYHAWRNNFEVVNTHGYFGTKSFHFCRVCEAMNYNDNVLSVYSERKLRQFLDPSLCAYKSKWDIPIFL